MPVSSYIRLIVLLTASLALMTPGCGKGVSEEDAVRAVIEDMADAANHKDAGRLKEHISGSYKDPGGNDHDALKGIIAYNFIRADSINVFLRKTDIKVNGDRAHATVRAVISRGGKVESMADLVPESAAGFIFDFEFTKDGSDWLLTSAIWRQVGVA
ncbi:MAG TPA: hypothetical protein VGB23_03450, partial [Nitrospirota bacterium]